MHTLTNDHLKISIRQPGAELCKVTSVKSGNEFMWHGDPEVWSGIAPNLFPIIGALKGDTYILDEKIYQMPKHGFLRKSHDIILVEQTKNSLTYKLESNPKLLKVYPFAFEFYITYTLEGNSIIVDHKVINTDTKTLYFSLGGHPAFKCPLYKDEQYTDYQLVFEHNENLKTHLLNLETGLFTGDTAPVFYDNNTIDLRYDLFNEDALVFKDLKSRKVSLQHKTKGIILSMYFKDFPYLGIWAKPNADYVCIEPWLGHADYENTNQQFTTKKGSRALEAGQEFRAAYNIILNEKHL